MGASKGSNICFPYSQKFMSDGSAIGAYLLQLDSTIGRERLRIAAAVSYWRRREGGGRGFKEPKRRMGPGVWKIVSFILLIFHTVHPRRHTKLTDTSGPPHKQPSVKYWLRDNGPLVECIYYASVVNNTPKWASKRWLLDMLSCFLRTPPIPPSCVTAFPHINNSGHVAHTGR